MYKQGKQGLSEIYVIGCGESLKDFNWSYLKDKTTIAVNGALLDVPSPDFFITADSFFARRACLCNFWYVRTYKVLVMKEDHKNFGRVSKYLYKWNRVIEPTHFNGELSLTEDKFATGQNSGFCGMQLAAILGAHTIHLLGFDFCGGVQHGNYHKRYCSNPNKWDEFLTHFKTGITRLRKVGVEVVSHSQISRLNNFINYIDIP